MILIICQEMGLIELFKRSFSRSERSSLTHFPISILFSSNEVLPHVIASCSFVSVNPDLKYERSEVTQKAIFNVQFGPL